jgi:type I restriction enzyme, S subunit
MSEYLRDSCTLKGGTGFPESLQGKQEGELPFIKVSDMSLPGNEKFITTANNYVAHEVAAQICANVFSPRATVFAKVGAALLLNRRRMLTEPTIIDNNMMAATPTTADPDFLYYFLSSVDFGNYVQTGALPSVNQ